MLLLCTCSRIIASPRHISPRRYIHFTEVDNGNHFVALVSDGQNWVQNFENKEVMVRTGVHLGMGLTFGKVNIFERKKHAL